MNRVSNAVRSALVVVADTDEAEADYGPSEADLAEIEAEMPLILARLDALEAEIALTARPGCELAQRAHRRAVNRVLALAAVSGASAPVEVA